MGPKEMFIFRNLYWKQHFPIILKMVIKKEKFLKKAFCEQFGIGAISPLFIFHRVSKYLVPYLYDNAVFQFFSYVKGTFNTDNRYESDDENQEE